ncbi:MAG: amidase [Cellulomonadaceae bacterium]
MAELHDLSARDLAAAVRKREVSALEVAEHTLDRATRLGPPVGAFVTLTPKRALEQARAADALLASGRERSGLPPLLGVPCPIKDLTMVAGVPFSAGSAALAGYIAPEDDGIVTLLRRAGTVMIGKTSTPELGLPAYTEPDVGPTARTPWDLTRSAGGSSGGAAAAVAARIVPVAQGSDGGGSLRIPASACGLVGLKASRGLVSPGPHGVDGAGLVSAGALTRDVRDTAALLDVVAVPWPGDTFTAPRPRDSFLTTCDEDPGRLRIGLLTTPVITADAAVDPQVLAATEAVARELVALGHDVVVAAPPFPPQAWDAFAALWSVGALQAPVPPEAEPALVPLTRWLRERGRGVSGVQYAQALGAAQRLTRQVATAWADLDVVVSPTLAQLPAPVGSQRDDADPAADFAAQMRFTPWTSVWNLTGRPAISLPLGEARAGGVELPVGVMLGARWGEDALLLALAAQLEAQLPWAGRRPAWRG